MPRAELLATLRLAVTCGAACLAGCGLPGPVRIRLGPDVRVPPRSAVIFFVDGLDLTRLDAGIAAGELPNIAERFARGGVRVTHAIASMPSNTYPNTVSLLTGQFPGHHGILGNRWFDRYEARIERYTTAITFQNANGHFRAATLFEMLSDRLTVAVQLHTRRGATVALEDLISGGLIWLFGGYERFDSRPAEYLTRIFSIAERARRWPVLIVNYFPGIDEIGHRFGEDSDAYSSALHTIDRQIGRITSALGHAGLADSTYFVLVSDHGLVEHDPGVFLNVPDWLQRQRGMQVHKGQLRKQAFASRVAKIDPYDAVVISGAYRRCAIHLRGPGGWHEPPDSSLVADVASAGLHLHPAVEFVTFRESPGSIRIISATGGALVERRTTSAAANEYRLVVERGDPLDIAEDAAIHAFVAAGWHSSREWLAATAATRYPDFVPQIVEMFDSHRAGDIVLFASDRGTFELIGKSGHGSCLADDMNVPMFFSGPGLPRGGRIEYARSVDLAPTILDLLGEPRNPNAASFDGVSIAEQLMNARTSTR